MGTLCGLHVLPTALLVWHQGADPDPCRVEGADPKLPVPVGQSWAQPRVPPASPCMAADPPEPHAGDSAWRRLNSVQALALLASCSEKSPSPLGLSLFPAPGCDSVLSLQRLSALSASLARAVAPTHEEEVEMDEFPVEGVSSWWGAHPWPWGILACAQAGGLGTAPETPLCQGGLGRGCGWGGG